MGGTGKDVGKRHPTIGNGVTIGAGAKVLGPIHIGDQSLVGAGSIVLKDVPGGCTVVGNPGRIVKKKEQKKIDLDQCNLPDPILENICRIKKRLNKIEEAIKLSHAVEDEINENL